MAIFDSGERREFKTGAVRDIQENKGRCDLLPLDIVGNILTHDVFFFHLDAYVRSGNTDGLYNAIHAVINGYYHDDYTAILELAKHYEEGANKYSERNWEKGIPLHCYIDSAVRHYLKELRGDYDESHLRAVLWNLVGALWTHEHKPELIDLPFAKEKDNESNTHTADA